MSSLRPAINGDATWLIVVAASMWGVSSILRDPLSRELAALTIVLNEHAFLVCLGLPWLVPALRELARCRVQVWLSVLAIGGGSSALATVLFTAAFRIGDPITPQVIQKLQPLFAMLLAAAILGERLRRRFALFAIPAIVGTWMLAFPDPLGVSVASLTAGLLALGSAFLWAAGTVLGRLASADLAFVHILVLRFFVGFLTLLLVSAAVGTQLLVPLALAPRLGLLAVGPGFIALFIYYFALRRTPAFRATLAELAFPLSAAAVGVTILGGHMEGTQWLGFVVLLASVTALGVHERVAINTAVIAPNDAAVALQR